MWIRHFSSSLILSRACERDSLRSEKGERAYRASSPTTPAEPPLFLDTPTLNYLFLFFLLLFSLTPPNFCTPLCAFSWRSRKKRKKNVYCGMCFVRFSSINFANLAEVNLGRREGSSKKEMIEKRLHAYFSREMFYSTYWLFFRSLTRHISFVWVSIFWRPCWSHRRLCLRTFDNDASNDVTKNLWRNHSLNRAIFESFC